jgi:TRAP transporter 4TM/12TM fusion protein
MKIDEPRASKLEQEFDPEVNFRTLTGWGRRLVTGLLIILAIFHYYTAGFGILPQHIHTGIHLTLVIFLIFLLFSFSRDNSRPPKTGLGYISGAPLTDWGLALLAAGATAYIFVTYNGFGTWLKPLGLRVGNPLPIDIVVGSILVVSVIEAARRVMGLALPIIVLIFICYALFGIYAPGPLKHPGTTWGILINQLYLTSDGIFSTPLKVVATYVFHFVLFGVMASRAGLSQLFIDLAFCLAGRYSGGPAKVSVLSSAMFGTLSGSSIANTVTTGALTIPAMKRVGYSPPFAAGVEAAASAGGQITPPIMGAAAFLMAEFLEVPYLTIILAALAPAAMHFIGVLVMVHLEAKRLGLKGQRPEELPVFIHVIKKNWLALIPLVVLLVVLFMGYTPYKAAFWGITVCVAVWAIRRDERRMTLSGLIDALALGSKYALSVGAAAAAVGIVIGVIALSGMGFRIAHVITQEALFIAQEVVQWIPALSEGGVALFLTLLFVAVTCIAMGAGLPTTSTYLILVSMVAPALTMLGKPAIVAHFFVLYYGVLADITPPVALAAYAGAGIAGCNPFKAGLQAFKLGNGKALVPFVFAYSPALLVVTDEFNWPDFIITFSGCALGIIVLGTALTGFMLRPLGWITRGLLVIAAISLVAPGLNSAFIGLGLVLIVVLGQIVSIKNQRALAAQ